jgi:O-acetyl-ADP-ribose deacetylase (regulator of RNase III)
MVKVGDLTQEVVDAIVNAANSSLLGGGGVDGAIHRAGGPAILDACREIRATRYPEGLPTGQAVITPGGALRAKFVIHTVGPVYGRHGGEEARVLAACYSRACALAAANALSSLAFPAISTGIFGYPREEAADVVSRTLKQALHEHARLIDIRLVFFSDADAQSFVANQRAF